MSNDNKIECVDGGFYAVNAAGHLISAKVIKDGMRWATEAEVATVTKIEADRAARESKAAKSDGGPLKGV